MRKDKEIPKAGRFKVKNLRTKEEELRRAKGEEGRRKRKKIKARYIIIIKQQRK